MNEHHIEALVEQVVADGKLTREELRRLDAMMLADGQLTLEERKQLDRLLTLIGEGRVQVVD